MKSLRLVPILATSALLLVACGGGDDDSTPAGTSGSGDTVAASDTMPPAPTDPAASGDTTAPPDPVLEGFPVLDVFTLTVDSPSHLAGSLELTGLATADPLTAPRCSGAMNFIDVSYNVEDSTTTGLPVEWLAFTADNIDGPGTYPTQFSFSSPVGPPSGAFPFTEVTGAEGEITVTEIGDQLDPNNPGDTIAGSFTIADDGFGTPITGSWTCTTTIP